MRKIKLCKDCKYFKYTFTFWGEYHRCKHPKFKSRDIITGKQNNVFCSINRQYDNLCGDEAKHFEQKKTWLKRIFS